MTSSHRIAASPLDEQQIRAESSGWLANLVDDDLDTIRRAVPTLERGWPRVNRPVAANRVGIASVVIGGKKSRHLVRGGG